MNTKLKGNSAPKNGKNGNGSKAKKRHVTLAMTTDEPFDTLEEEMVAREREKKQFCREEAEARRKLESVKVEATLEPEAVEAVPEVGISGEDSEVEAESKVWTWRGIKVYDDEVVESLALVQIPGVVDGVVEAISAPCLICRRIGHGTERYLVPLVICLDEGRDFLEFRFEMVVDPKFLRQQGTCYRVGLRLKNLLTALAEYQFNSDDAAEQFRASAVEAIARIVLEQKHEELSVMNSPRSAYYTLATAPLGNAMLIEASAKVYGEEVKRELRLYALGDIPQGDGASWRLRYSDARELLREDWLMPEYLTELLFSDVSDDLFERFFSDESFTSEDLAGTVLAGAEKVELLPTVWVCPSLEVKVVYDFCLNGCRSNSSMLGANIGNFTVWHCPERSTQGILMKKEV